MKNTTLCYIRNDRGQTLLLHRVKKENDLNHDKWIGVGGKFEDKESPEDCLLREVKEETGLTLTAYRYRGIVTFVSAVWETELMHLFTADGFEGTLRDCDEGTLEWVDDAVVPTCPPGQVTACSSICWRRISPSSRSSWNTTQPKPLPPPSSTENPSHNLSCDRHCQRTTTAARNTPPTASNCCACKSETATSPLSSFGRGLFYNLRGARQIIPI